MPFIDSEHLSPEALRRPSPANREHASLCPRCAALLETVTQMSTSSTSRAGSSAHIDPIRLAEIAASPPPQSDSPDSAVTLALTDAELAHLTHCDLFPYRFPTTTPPYNVLEALAPPPPSQHTLETLTSLPRDSATPRLRGSASSPVRDSTTSRLRDFVTPRLW